MVYLLSDEIDRNFINSSLLLSLKFHHEYFVSILANYYITFQYWQINPFQHSLDLKSNTINDITFL